MKKILTLLIIFSVSQLATLNVLAGSDGSLEINTTVREKNDEVRDCFETINRGVFAFNQGLDKVFFKSHGSQSARKFKNNEGTRSSMVLYVQEVVTRPKILNRTILSN